MTRVFSDHCGPKGDKGDVGPPGTAGISAIGTPITASIANAILFADASGTLAQDADFIKDGPEIYFGDATGVGALVDISVAGGFYIQSDATHFVQVEPNGIDFVAGSTEFRLDVIAGHLQVKGGAFSPVRVDINETTGDVTIPALAGAGVRAVFVDANGKLSAP